jgi:hypothetical protein
MSDGAFQFEISNLKFELRVAESRKWRSKRAEKLKSKKERKKTGKQESTALGWSPNLAPYGLHTFGTDS